jgi:hypothetical protein
MHAGWPTDEKKLWIEEINPNPEKPNFDLGCLRMLGSIQLRPSQKYSTPLSRTLGQTPRRSFLFPKGGATKTNNRLPPLPLRFNAPI